MSEHDAAGNAQRPRAPGTAIAFGRRLAVELERTITAPMDAVWSMLRDYRARERLLGAEFADYVVRAGGVGEGTVIAYRLRISQRAWRTCLQALREAGTLIDTPDGSITQLAAWELERRSAAAARRRLAVAPRQPDGENAEKHSKNNRASAPHTPPLNHIPITP